MYKVAIDASRNRSGGAKAHLIGIISNCEPERYKIDEVHVLAPNRLWLKVSGYAMRINRMGTYLVSMMPVCVSTGQSAPRLSWLQVL